jgi:predicted phosphodiesterase
MKYLVISDTHVSPACPFYEGWRKLGQYIVKNKPKYIVHLGDVADLNSLARYVTLRGDYSTEEELDCTAIHLNCLEVEIEKEQEKNRHDKKKVYKPIKILCLGNHDVRKDTTLIKDLFEQHGWIVAEYQTPLKIDNILFSHCIPRPNSDLVCVQASEILSVTMANTVVGHSHVRDYAESYSYASNDIVRAIKCPCFTDEVPCYSWNSTKIFQRGWLEIDTDPFQFTWRDISCLPKSS